MRVLSFGDLRAIGNGMKSFATTDELLSRGDVFRKPVRVLCIKVQTSLG